MPELTMVALIQESCLKDEQKKQLLDLYTQKGNSPEFMEQLDLLMGTEVEDITAQMIVDCQEIENDVAAIDATVTQQANAMAEEFAEQMKSVDEWDLDKQRALFAEYGQKKDAFYANERKKLDVYATKTILKE